MKLYTVEVGGVIAGAESLAAWLDWALSASHKPFLQGGRRVGFTELPPGGCVSTMFLGPEFETMVFWPDGSEVKASYQQRCLTHAEAVVMHARGIQFALGSAVGGPYRERCNTYAAALAAYASEVRADLGQAAPQAPSLGKSNT